MWQIKKLFKSQQIVDSGAILALLVFLSLSLLVQNVKIFYVLAFSFFAFLTLTFSFPKAFIYSTIPFSFVSLAQVHPILVVPTKAIVTNQYWEGRHIVFSFAPYFFISLIALISIASWKKKLKSRNQLTNIEKLVIISFACGILSGIYGSLISTLSVFSVFSQFLGVLWAWYLSKSLKVANQLQKQSIWLTLFTIIAIIISFESLIVFKQTISKSPAGLAIEKTGFAPAFGAGADENIGEFRPFGLQAHPNGLANKQLILGFSAWLIFLQLKFKKSSKIAQHAQNALTFILSLMLINIILSLSRAVYLGLFVGSLFIFLRQRKESFRFIQKLKKTFNHWPTRYKFLFLLFAYILIFKLGTRMINSIYSFSEFGGVNTRLEQYKEAIEVFKKSPIFGIGDEMFIPTSYQLFPSGVMTYFPENVHNGFLLFTIERGLLGLIVYLIFIILTVIKISQSKIKKINKSIVYSGLIAIFSVMIFHPEKNFFNIFLLLALVITDLNYEKNL